ncbi:ubiquinol-cytochrome c reductase iron-sulfur subunit [Ostreibacterium oceani]|uniref:Ubiquinol-cytochrome c reductase iron-sulfur subunit n=1 Tax=Ostreibacterium oceani TaxID=2654998 RepID=A0A6N7EYR4_9GAMM|nr:ubiquinol-cytochrome c reductase iron-sulfur subunit [Ostreibacterium oceani]MPV86695.1 ubiquinol-cytochrome c reductase iron-sulfur subunit [Ostreibacterium oceani]
MKKPMKNSEKVNHARRKTLVIASSALGGVAVAGVATPFLGSWMPSEKAKSVGAPIEMDISKLPPGAQQRAVWRGKAIYVLRMTEPMLKAVKETESSGLLLDPNSEASDLPETLKSEQSRQLRDDIMVLIGVCTHLGCAPTLQGVDKGQSHTPGWLGGFFCACHGSKYDYAGRVYRGVPAPKNLPIPPYRFENDGLIVIGEEETV